MRIPNKFNGYSADNRRLYHKNSGKTPKELRRLYGIQADNAEYMLGVAKNQVFPAYTGMMNQARDYGSLANQEAMAGRAGADAMAATTAQNQAMENQMTSAGVNIGDERFARGLRGNAVQNAAMMAGATTGARNAAQDKGYAMMQDAVALGMGTPTQATQALNSAGSMIASGASIANQQNMMQQQALANTVSGGMNLYGMYKTAADGGYISKYAAGGMALPPLPPPSSTTLVDDYADKLGFTGAGKTLQFLGFGAADGGHISKYGVGGPVGALRAVNPPPPPMQGPSRTAATVQAAMPLMAKPGAQMIGAGVEGIGKVVGSPGMQGFGAGMQNPKGVQDAIGIYRDVAKQAVDNAAGQTAGQATGQVAGQQASQQAGAQVAEQVGGQVAEQAAGQAAAAGAAEGAAASGLSAGAAIGAAMPWIGAAMLLGSALDLFADGGEVHGEQDSDLSPNRYFAHGMGGSDHGGVAGGARLGVSMPVSKDSQLDLYTDVGGHTQYGGIKPQGAGLRFSKQFADGGMTDMDRLHADRKGIKRKQFDDGGDVNGPGGPKEDAIPAWLSDGEFVLPVGAVKLLGIDTLEKIRQAGLQYEQQMGIERV